MASKSKSKAKYYTIWPTAWGPVGATAGKNGISRFILPHYQADDLEDLIRWENPEATRDDAPFAEMIELTRDYFNARVVDFSSLNLDLPKESTFGGIVLRACSEIPYGRSKSYSALAREIRRPEAARAVATALSKNVLPLVVPCHRVTYADARPGGFSAAGGPELKQRMLDLEARVRA
jgi:methylated-DNA-[protein]-cysteine S-methyltransferase